MRLLNVKQVILGRRVFSLFLAVCMFLTSAQSQAGRARETVQMGICIGLLTGALATFVPDSVPKSLHNKPVTTPSGPSASLREKSLGSVFFGRAITDISQALQFSFGLVKKTYFVSLGEMSLAYSGVRSLISQDDAMVQVDTYQNADGVAVLDMHLASARAEAQAANQEVASLDWSTMMLAAARDGSKEVFSRAASNVLLSGQRVLLVLDTMGDIKSDIKVGQERDRAARAALIETLARYLSITAGLFAVRLALSWHERIANTDNLFYAPVSRAAVLFGLPAIVAGAPLAILALALTNPASFSSRNDRSGPGVISGDALGGAALLFSYLRNGH